MATADPASPAAVLRGLLDRHVTVTTSQATFRGTVLHCTRRSVWLVDGDLDAVVPLDRITGVVVDSGRHAA